MNRHLLRISLIALLMCLLMVFAGASAVVSAAAADKTDAEAVCIPNEVVVMFNSNAVKDSNMSLKAARRLENVAPDYGSISEAVGEEDKAAVDAKGEVAILSDSLGDDFVIEDSMIFDAGSSGGGASALSVDGEAGSAAKALTLALVSSAMFFFAFTTLLSFAVYADANIQYVLGSTSDAVKRRAYTVGCLIIAVLALLASLKDMTTAWNYADVGVGIMCWLNFPVLVLMAPKSFKILKDYEDQKKMGLDPVFIPEDIGFDNCELWDEIVDEKYADLKAAKRAAMKNAK